MKSSLINDKRGIGHMALIIGVAVVLVVGGVGYYVYNKNKKDKNSTTTASNAVSSAAADACNKLYNDKDLCKFVSNYKLNSAYKATFTDKDKTGKVTTITSDSDGKGNSSSTSKDGDNEVSAFVILNGDSYLKNEADGSWTKYPKADNSQTNTSPTSDLKLDANAEESKPADQRITYKKLGKEKVGTVNCFKYQITDPSQPGTTSIIWFGDKDYQLHKWSFTNSDGSVSEGTFTYTSVTVSTPSPVKAAPSTPSQTDIQNYLNQAQNSAQ